METITTPIEVKTTTKRCSNKCSYKFDYGTSPHCLVTNNTSYLSLSYKDSSADVKYNDSPCHVQEIRLYKPSLNNYYGSKVDAELIINHTTNGGNNLLVCIPIRASSAKSNSSTMLQPIIQLAPINESEGSSHVNIPNYSLNNVVPSAPFYSFEGTLPYDDNNGTYNVIIFDSKASGGTITITPVSLETLGTIIDPTDNPFNNSYNINDVFYNKDGTAEPPSSDDIYIDCQMVDSSGNVVVNEDDGKPANDRDEESVGDKLKDLFESPWFDTLLGIGVVALLVHIKNKYQ